MNKEQKALLVSMLDNLVVSLMKVLGGIYSKSNSLIADGFHTFSDFITDIVAMIGSKISKRRANKKYPFGFGRVEYITSIFIGVTILILGVYITISSFTKKPTTPASISTFIIIIAILLKLISTRYLMNQGTKYHSQILITSSKESFTDVYSSIGVLVIIVLSQFQGIIPVLKYTDILGSFLLGLLIIKTSYDLLKDNIISLIGKSEENDKLKAVVEKIVNAKENIRFKKVNFIKNGSYYLANIDIECLENIRVNELLKKEKSTKKEIKTCCKKIKYIDINIVPKDE